MGSGCQMVGVALWQSGNLATWVARSRAQLLPHSTFINMPHAPVVCHVMTPLLLLLAAQPAAGHELTTLAEAFRPGHAYRVDVQVKLDGKLSLPGGKDKPHQVVPLAGASRLTYDERIL